MHIKGVLFDFMGTTAIERDPTMIHQCIIKTFSDHGVFVPDEMIRMNRGKDKKEMILSVLDHYYKPHYLLPGVLNAFNESLANNLDNFKENSGTREIIQFLKEKNIITGLGTGFAGDIFTVIFRHLDWESIGFDYIGIAGEKGRGRPHPDMIINMLKKFGLQKNQFLKVGDTIADIQEGKNAGVKTVAVLAGTQDEKEIIKQQPDFIIHQLLELKEIING